MSIRIVTDSTAYIPTDLQQKYHISVISLNIISNGVSEREVEVDLAKFYDSLAQLDKIPTSSQPIP